MKTIFLSF